MPEITALLHAGLLVADLPRARRFYERHGFAAVAFGVSPAPESEPKAIDNASSQPTSRPTDVGSKAV